MLRILGKHKEFTGGQKRLTFLLLLSHTDNIKDGHTFTLVHLCIHENAYQTIINYLLGLFVYILNNKTTVWMRLRANLHELGLVSH